MEDLSHPVHRTTKRCPSSCFIRLLRTLTLGSRRSVGVQITASCSHHSIKLRIVYVVLHSVTLFCVYVVLYYVIS